MRSRNWSRTLTERSGGNGAVAVFMACYDCFFVQYMLWASKQQARYGVGRCLMLWSSNDVTQQGSRPKTKLGVFSVVVLELNDPKGIIRHFVNHSVLIRNSTRPITGQSMF